MISKRIMKRKVLVIGVSLFHLFTFSPLVAQSVLTLEQLKDSALQNNMAIRAARFDIEAAQQQRREAFTKYFPNISGTGLWFNANKGMAKMDVNPSEVIPASLSQVLAQQLPAEMLPSLATPVSISMMKNGTIGALTAMQPLFAGGQIINGNKLAKVGEDVSRLQLQLSENEVEKTVEQYYWKLVSLQEKMKTIQAVEAFLNDVYKDVDVAVRAGVALPNDRLQVQLRQNDVASQKLKLENGITTLKLLIAQYCGLKSEDFLREKGIVNSEKFATAVESEELRVKSEESAAAVDSSAAGSPVGNSSLFTLHSSLNNSSLFTFPFSLSSLPEYQLLGKQVEATALQKKMAVGQNLPSVAVGAGYNYHNLLDNDRTFGMIFATVSVPISDWWGGSHAVKRRKIEHQKALEQMEDTQQLLVIRMQNAWNGVQESYQQLLLAQKGIEQAEENLRLNRNYYQAGTARMSDLLEAQLLYQQSCDKRTDAFADYQLKQLDYRQATGQK